MRKKRIQQHFEASLPTYERHASAQAAIAARLAGLVRQHVQDSPSRVLELGCGTGILSRMLKKAFPSAQLHLNDLNGKAFDAVRHLSGHFIPGDAETIELPSRMDLVASSSTFHWFDDLPGLFGKLRSLVNKGGLLAFSSFGPDNLREIRTLRGKGLNYLNRGKIVETLKENGFDIIHASDALMPLVFETPREVLRHLKLTGVNGGFSSCWTKSGLSAFTTEYIERFSTGGGVTLTYHPLYVIAQISSR